jgi:hypothetical protein
MPVIGINRSVLIDRLISLIGREKFAGDDGEKSLFYLRICIDCRDECLLWIELLHLFIGLHRIGDIGSLYFTFMGEISRMSDAHDLHLAIPIFLEDLLCMSLSIWSTSLDSEE